MASLDRMGRISPDVSSTPTSEMRKDATSSTTTCSSTDSFLANQQRKKQRFPARIGQNGTSKGGICASAVSVSFTYDSSSSTSTASIPTKNAPPESRDDAAYIAPSSGGAKPATAAAVKHDTTPRRQSQNAEIAALPTVPAAPSYVLSEQRRSELLLAARTNRVSWVDGVDERQFKSLPVGSGEFPMSLTASTIPSHCREALEGVSGELHKFFESLDELKHKILATDLELTEEETEPAADAQYSARRYHTLFQELKEQETLLDQWQRSHSPRTRKLTGHDREMAFLVGFRELVALLKNAQAAELVYRIQSFVKRAELWDLPAMLRAIATRDRPGGKVHDFIKKLVEQIKHSNKLRSLLQGETVVGEVSLKFLHVRDEYGVDLLHEVLEAFLMEKLYAKTLTPSSDVARQDEALHERISLLGFVTFKHLDLPVPKTEEEEQTWLRLAGQLKAMTLCPSPRRKMDGVLRVCQDLTIFLKSQKGGKFPSADEFLPALIYVVLRANPSELKRNVAYILEYRSPSKLVSEPGYFFTHLVSSVAFLEEVNGSLLTISAEEFDEGLRRSKEGLRQRGVHREVDHEVASNASSSSTNNGETLNGNTKSLQNEHLKSMQNDHDFNTQIDSADPLHLPNVLEIRAKRLATLGCLASVAVDCMRMSGPRVALRAMARLARSKRRVNRVSLTSSEEVPAIPRSTIINSENCGLDNTSANQHLNQPGDSHLTPEDTIRATMQSKESRRGIAIRRHWLMKWRSQAATTAVRTLRGCYLLARHELVAWRSRSKVPSSADEEEETSESKSTYRKSCGLKRPRTNSRISAASSSSNISSLSSMTDMEEDLRKEFQRSEFSLRVRRSSSLEMKPSKCGFAETTSGSHERLLLVNALQLNDSDDEDNESSSSASRHLPAGVRHAAPVPPSPPSDQAQDAAPSPPRAVQELRERQEAAPQRQTPPDPRRRGENAATKGADPRTGPTPHALQRSRHRFDPQGAPQQADETRKFLLSTFDVALKTPDFTGLEHLMKQWGLLSVYHKSVFCHIDGVEIVDQYEKLQVEDERKIHVVRTHGVTTLEISRATIESVFPHILADESLAQSLMGKRYSFSFTLIAYVNAVTGRVFQLESKIDLTSALMDLLQDPFVTVQMVNSTTMNKRGNLLLHEDVREDQNIIEHGFL
ncbi:unnamed protein product [Phytophthora lilii]|uniref:Unnamed protein product n=1 Tax=Phytophthora lilii TaxID=2077276 RepID=A0A9W6U8C2_9STRA|nr:unnamed protein product [Phytophthora lilii]